MLSAAKNPPPSSTNQTLKREDLMADDIRLGQVAGLELRADRSALIGSLLLWGALSGVAARRLRLSPGKAAAYGLVAVGGAAAGAKAAGHVASDVLMAAFAVLMLVVVLVEAVTLPGAVGGWLSAQAEVVADMVACGEVLPAWSSACDHYLKRQHVRLCLVGWSSRGDARQGPCPSRKADASRRAAERGG